MGYARAAQPMSPTLKKLAPFALAALSGGLYALACPPWNAVPLAFVGWVPLLAALRGARPAAALRLGVVHGAVATVLMFGWMASVFRTFVGGSTWLTALLTVLFFAMFGLRFVILAVVVTRADAQRWPRGVAFAASLVAVEVANAWLAPWMTGYQLHAAPVLAQSADLGGPHLVTFALALVNVGVEEAIARARARRWPGRASFGLALGVPVALGIYGGFVEQRTRAREASAPAARVGLVQVNTRITDTAEAALEAYRTTTRALVASSAVDLVVWPETALGTPMSDFNLEDALRRRAFVTAATPSRQPWIQPSLLTGALVFATGDHAPSNVAALLDGTGRLVGEYTKVSAMPLGEQLPFGNVFPVLYTWFPNAGRLVVAPQPAVVTALGHRVQVRICYEEALGEATRRAVVANDPELFVALTNDAWFGTTPAWAFHLAAARFRAIEHHRYYVRAVNNGPSGIIDPRGHVAAETAPFASGSVVGDIRWLRPTTLYARVGDAPAYALLVLTVVMLIVRAPRRLSRGRHAVTLGANLG